MIEGLKVTLTGEKLKALAISHAEHHESRMLTYAAQVESMTKAKVEGMEYTNGDPIRNLTERREQHASAASELRFIADNIKLSEEYLLDNSDLVKLGVLKSRW